MDLNNFFTLLDPFKKFRKEKLWNSRGKTKNGVRFFIKNVNSIFFSFSLCRVVSLSFVVAVLVEFD